MYSLDEINRLERLASIVNPTTQQELVAMNFSPEDVHAYVKWLTQLRDDVLEELYLKME